MGDPLERTYSQLTYPASLDGEELELRPGHPCPALDRALARRGLDSAAYVTAYGPAGQPASPARDEPRQEALRAELRGRYAWVEAPGGWPEGLPNPDGLREPSLLVLGLAPEAAAALGAHFEQRAIVVHVRGKATVLRMLGDGQPYPS